MPRPRCAPLAGALLATTLALAAAGCGDDTDDGTAAAAPTPSAGGLGADLAARPAVTFSAADNVLDLPSEVPAGLVDVRLESEPGQIGHHLAVARLNEGVTYDDITGLDEESIAKLTIVGGNGTVAPGVPADMTLDLDPGDYLVVDIGQAGDITAQGRFSVAEPDGDVAQVAEPQAEGTVTMGPGMVITVPDGFDGTGTWRFENVDPELNHEAALVKLADGATVENLVTWAHAPAGPPPLAGEVGGMGAVGPGQSAWFTLEPDGPGEYALVCWVPGEGGVPHMGAGMATGVSVR
jgi:hypothetical protein